MTILLFVSMGVKDLCAEQLLLSLLNQDTLDMKSQNMPVKFLIHEIFPKIISQCLKLVKFFHYLGISTQFKRHSAKVPNKYKQQFVLWPFSPLTGGLTHQSSPFYPILHIYLNQPTLSHILLHHLIPLYLSYYSSHKTCLSSPSRHLSTIHIPATSTDFS